jgi:hypothetical protein
MLFQIEQALQRRLYKACKPINNYTNADEQISVIILISNNLS